MKICLLNIAYYPNVEGGAEVSTQKLAEAFAKEHRVYVICTGNTEENQRINNVHILHIPARYTYKNKIDKAINSRYNFHIKADLVKLLQKICPDVIHTNNLHEFTVIVWNIAAALNIPVIHTLRDYTLANPRHWIGKKIVSYSSKNVSIVTAPSNYTLAYFNNMGLFYNAILSKVVYNAIDFDIEELEKLAELKTNILNKKHINFAYLGRYSEEKGVNWLIRIFSLFSKNSTLHLFGKGTIDDEVSQHIDNVKIINHGFLYENELREYLKNIDVIIAPSKWDEPFGRIVLDAYRSICPVIVTNRGGLPEIVEDGKTGLIIKERDDELIFAINYMECWNNIKLMIPSILRIIKKFEIDYQKEQFINLYRKALGLKD